MFLFIRRHQTIGLLFIGLVILSFIIFFSPYAQLDDALVEENYGAIDGQTIRRDEYLAANKEAQLAFYLHFQMWPGEDEMSRQRYDANREALNRLVLGRKVKELGIEVSNKAVADRIAELFRNQKTGAFDLRNYDAYIQKEFWPRGINQIDFERFIKHELAVQQVVAVAGVSGALVTPREAEASYRLENEQVQAQVVLFASSNHLAKVNLEPLELSKFFTNREAMYRIPEKIQVSYVRFETTNFLAEADQQIAQLTNFNQQVEMTYRQQTPDFYKDDSGQPMTPEAAQLKIKDQFRRSLALRTARKQANDFATELFAQPPQADSLDKLAAAKGLEAKVTQPFAEFEGPRDLKVPATFARAAFKLKAEQPVSESPVVAEDGVYLFALKTRHPSTIPPFETVQSKVTEDYRQSQVRIMVREEGVSFAGAVTNGLAQGKTFAAICDDAKVKPIRPPPFSQKTRTLPELDRHVSASELTRVAFDLSPGRASGFISSRDGGFVLYAEGRVPVEETKLKLEMAGYLEELRQGRRDQAFNEWFRKQMEQANISSPLAKTDAAK